MLAIETLDTRSAAHVKRFIRLPYRLYAATPQWVPLLDMDAREPLNRRKHPFYEHGAAEFFIAVREGRDLGRIAVLENRRYNEFRETKQAQFYFFECENDAEAAQALFECAFDWARARGLNKIIGPRGFGAYDGYGLLIDGFQHRQMVMMNYNPAYYVALVEQNGFAKEVDFVSCYGKAETYRVPERVHRIAARVQERGELRVQRFTTKKEIRAWLPRILQAYNNAFVHNWEYYPLSDRQVKYIADTLMLVGDPKLIKLILHGDTVVGFMFAFPDVSAAMQRARGKLFPFGLVDLLIEMRRTKWGVVNAGGILPEFHGIGGNALLYAEMERTLRERTFEFVETSQVAETAVEMRRDLENLGTMPYKTHRVYQRAL